MADKGTGAATVSDVSLDVAGADSVEAFVVEPRDGKARAGILFLHWLSEHHNDRSRAVAELVAPIGKNIRLAIVGHDFGAMHGTLLAARQPRAKALVVVAAPPRWADWFLPFWPIAGDPIDYRRRLAPFDPTAALPKTKADLLFQFSRRDFYLAPMSGRELASAAGRDAAIEWYQADHAMRSARARAARATFLRRTLQLD